MKKLVLLLAVAFGVSLFSCGGAKTEAAAADSTATTDSAATEQVDSAKKDSTVKEQTPADSAKEVTDSVKK